jgi:glycerophosphoryl diester phosphodiesterase
MLETRSSPGVTSVIAHRGASRKAPENTVEAFTLAAELGADLVELDVRATRDRALVVHHDAHLADGRAVATIDAGDMPPDLPTLAVALEACSALRGVNVEIKHQPGEPGFTPDRSLAALVVDEVRRLGQSDRVLISAFDLEMAVRAHSLAPEIAVAWLVVEPPPDAVATLDGRGLQALHPHHLFVTPALIGSCHAHGLAVNCWTLDDPARMVEQAGWGIDGICTNLPDVARAALASRT